MTPAILLRSHPAAGRRARGAASVEFALTAVAFMTLVFGVVEFGRMSWVLNAANDATRVGVRLAAVGEEGDAGIRQKMRAILPLLSDENIAISYPPANCAPYECAPVTVSIENLNFESFIPLLPIRVGLPSFRSSLTRESRVGAGSGETGDYCE